MRVVLQLREHLVAVELGHQDVEQQQVEPLLPQQVERLAAVLREDDRVPLLLEAAAEQEPVHAVVVRDQDRARSRRRESSRRRLRAEAGQRFLERLVLLLDPVDELRGAVEARRPSPAARACGRARRTPPRRASRRSTSACAPRAAAPRRFARRGSGGGSRGAPARRRGTCRSPRARKSSPPSSRRFSSAPSSRLT